MYYVYAIRNEEKDTIYVGQTNNPERRMIEHNSKSKHYTGKIVGKWELIYCEECIDRSSAIAREKELKSHRGRDFLKQHIKGK